MSFVIRHLNNEAISRETLKEQGFTDSAVRIFRDLRERAASRNLFGELPPLLLLWSILRAEKKLGAYILELCGVDLWELQKDVDAALEWAEMDPEGLEAVRSSEQGPYMDYTAVCRVAIRSREEASRLGTKYVGTEHMVLALCRSHDGAVKRILDKHEIDYTKLRRQLQWIAKYS